MTKNLVRNQVSEITWCVTDRMLRYQKLCEKDDIKGVDASIYGEVSKMLRRLKWRLERLANQIDADE